MPVGDTKRSMVLGVPSTMNLGAQAHNVIFKTLRACEILNMMV
jgi:hypothetical protein